MTGQDFNVILFLMPLNSISVFQNNTYSYVKLFLRNPYSADDNFAAYCDFYKYEERYSDQWTNEKRINGEKQDMQTFFNSVFCQKKLSFEECMDAENQKYKMLKPEAEKLDSDYTGAGERRARTRIKYLLQRNASKKMLFVTLTYEKLPDSFNSALKDMQRFIRRVGKYTNYMCKILYVPELGEENKRLHFHVLLCGRIPKTIEIRTKFWDKGIIDIQHIKKRKTGDSVSAVAAYLSKYITKSATPIKGRKRAYYISQNWESDIKKAYVPGTKFKSIIKKLNTIRTVTGSPAPMVSSIDINDQPAQVITYKFKDLDKNAIQSVLSKFEISLMNWDFMRKTEEMKAMIEAQNKIATFCRNTQKGINDFFLYDELVKELPLEKTEDEKKSFLDNVKEINKNIIAVPDLVYFKENTSFYTFLNNPSAFVKKREAFYLPNLRKRYKQEVSA